MLGVVVRADARLRSGRGPDAASVALPEGLDVVVYAASADARDPEAYERAYVRGVSNLLERLGSPHRKLGARVIQIAGSRDYESVRERSDGEVLSDRDAAVLGVT